MGWLPNDVAGWNQSSPLHGVHVDVRDVHQRACHTAVRSSRARQTITSTARRGARGGPWRDTASARPMAPALRSLGGIGRGTIPTSIGNLAKLQYLDLSGAALTGTIPGSIGNLVGLLHLDLHSCQLSGTLPGSIGSLLYMQWLSLSSNQLVGTIPASVGGLISLRYMTLDNNGLQGSIPASVGSMASLTHMCGLPPASAGGNKRALCADRRYRRA